MPGVIAGSREHKWRTLLTSVKFTAIRLTTAAFTVAGIDSVLQFEGCRLNRLDELVGLVNDFHEQAITIRRRDPR